MGLYKALAYAGYPCTVYPYQPYQPTYYDAHYSVCAT